MEDKIRIVIADDHKLFRKGIIALLSDCDFIGQVDEAENGVELLELLAKIEHLPDVLLLDLRMPLMDGIEAQKEIRQLYPAIKVIILTMEDDEQYLLHLISEGVNGYLLKNADPDEMEIAIRKVMKNGYYFTDDISNLVLRNLKKKDKAETVVNPDFTERELQVLELVCKEYSNGEIATALNISIRTAEGYRQKLVEKSGTKNIAGLVVQALKYNWVTI